MHRCRYCHQTFESAHYCREKERTVFAGDVGTTEESSESEKMLDSAIIGYATNSTVAGALLGGSLLGGMIGDSLRSDD